MTTRTRRKCRHCGQLFRPDPRNLRHQRYCSAKECRSVRPWNPPAAQWNSVCSASRSPSSADAYHSCAPTVPRPDGTTTLESIAEKIGSTSRYSEVRQYSNQSACAVLTGGPVTSAAPFDKR